MKIHTLRGFGRPTYTGVMFGVECEIEGRGLIGSQNLKWKTEHDGSLRDGLEYVFRGALNPLESRLALAELFGELKKAKAQLNYSFRTSTHVHLNVDDLDSTKVNQIIFLYTLVEDLFANFCDENRRGNRFCLRFKEAANLYGVFSKMIQEEEHPNYIARLEQNNLKYAALNLHTLAKYGTLEFRSLEGTNDQVKIDRWLKVIENLYNVAIRFESIAQLHEVFTANPSAIVDEVFTTDIGPELFKFQGWQQSIEDSYSQSYHLVMVSEGVL